MSVLVVPSIISNVIVVAAVITTPRKTIASPLTTVVSAPSATSAKEPAFWLNSKLPEPTTSEAILINPVLPDGTVMLRDVLVTVAPAPVAESEPESVHGEIVTALFKTPISAFIMVKIRHRKRLRQSWS